VNATFVMWVDRGSLLYFFGVFSSPLTSIHAISLMPLNSRVITLTCLVY